MDHCTLVMSKDHSQCDAHVVQRRALSLKIDDDVDNALGLTVRKSLLNEQQTQYVSVCTAELFARCLHVKCHFSLNFTVNISVNILSDFCHFVEQYLPISLAYVYI